MQAVVKMLVLNGWDWSLGVVRTTPLQQSDFFFLQTEVRAHIVVPGGSV